MDDLGEQAYDAIVAVQEQYDALQQADEEFMEARNKLADAKGEIETRAGELGFAPSDLMPDYQESVDLSLLTFPFNFSMLTNRVIEEYL